MISIYTVLTFMFIHWVFDFFLQTDEMARGKSSSNKHLCDHIGSYCAGLWIMALLNTSYFNFNFAMIAVWIILNSFFHFFTDYVTSRASSLLFKAENYHDAFVVIGIDQFIHYATLFMSFYYITTSK